MRARDRAQPTPRTDFFNGIRHFRTFASDAAKSRLEPFRTFPEAPRRAGSDPGLDIIKAVAPGWCDAPSTTTPAVCEGPGASCDHECASETDPNRRFVDSWPQRPNT